MNLKIYIAAFAMMQCSFLQAQELVTIKNAVDIALTDNHQIKIARNNLKIAENNASILNSGYLPSLNANASVQKKKEDTHVSLVGGNERYVNGANTDFYNYGLTLNYTLFDGLGRHYNYKKLKNTYNISQLQARLQIENTLMDLIVAYYDVANLKSQLKNQKETLDISRERIERVKSQFEYGQSSKLDVLRAEVDFNNDSINIMNIRSQLLVAERNFNVLLARDVSTQFEVDTNIVFSVDLEEQKILQLAYDQNVEYMIANQSANSANFDLKATRSGYLPKVDLSTGYNGSNTRSDGGAFLLNEAVGFNVRAGLTWNLFDGGGTHTRVQNAKILELNSKEQIYNLKIDLERRISNAYVSYQNSQFVMAAEKINLQTNRINFEYSRDKYNLGQINSIDYRKAQVDLLSSENRYSQAKFSAKVAELQLMKLAGLFLQELEN